MDDLISRQAVLQICREKIWNGADDYEPISSRGIAERVKAMPSVQPNLQPACNNLATDTISRQAAIDLAKDLIIPGADYLQHNQAIMNYEAELVRLPSAQPESEERKAEYAQNVPIEDLISRKAAIDALAELEAHYEVEDGHDHLLRMAKISICALPSAQPEPLTDKEQRIFLAAMGREEKVCEEVDRNYVREPYEDSLVRVCKEIRRKVKGALWI